MPLPKSKKTKGNSASKEQIAEKVKEMQLRQRNWMKQRERHLNSSPEPVSNQASANTKQWISSETKRIADRRESTERTAQGADILIVHHQDSSSHLLASDQLNVKVKHGFGAWLRSRKHGEDAGNHNHSNSQGFSEIDSHASSSASRVQEDGSFPPYSSLVSSLQSSSSSNPLSPAEFDSRADSIVARVKKDLGIRHGSGARPCGDGQTVDERPGRERTFVQRQKAEHTVAHNARGGGGGGGGNRDVHVNLSCHQCPVCSSLMASSANAPMLLVPCGHTVCRQCCSSSSSCQLCGSRMDSHTTNIMLQQIIHEFHGRSHQPEGSHAGAGASSSQSSTWQRSWERQISSQGTPTKTAAKQCDVRYAHELQSLRERQAALHEAAKSSKRETEHIGAKVKQAEKQLKAIEKEEESLMLQIQQLQKQLQGLQEHKDEYCGEYRQLQEKLGAAEEQSAMVQQCLKSLGEEIDKVQFLAEGQEDSYLQQQSHYR